jgi:hypothetical protein
VTTLYVTVIVFFIPICNELVNRDLTSHVTVTVSNNKGRRTMFGPDSQQLEYGTHTLVIDLEDHRVRVFSDLDAPEVESSRDWRDVSEKLSELGVRTLNAVREERQDSMICAEGSF